MVSHSVPINNDNNPKARAKSGKIKCQQCEPYTRLRYSFSFFVFLAFVNSKYKQHSIAAHHSQTSELLRKIVVVAKEKEIK